ncbi:hypothetical protein FRC03_011869 [Tulasnella sp. 419]|nr:hypothetical protein FRC03_011869 [Tulasnella sp. 419]
MAEQIEKHYQKQHLFQNAKIRSGKKVATKEKRWFKDVGLGYKTPTEAINGTYIDKKCPFTGNVSIRGRILNGKVVSTKMTRTVIIRRDYLHYIPKYNRYEKRHKNLAVHVSPCFRVEIGDMVTVGESTIFIVDTRTHITPIRPMSPVIQDSAVQRVASVSEQGGIKDVWQILRFSPLLCFTLPSLHSM